MNQPARVCDPESIRTDYIERKRRQKRVQYPPMSYWNKYAEMTDEDEFCRAITDVMDKMCGPFLILVPVLIIALISYHLQLVLLPIVTIILGAPLFWWYGWGRKRYE